MSRARLRWLLVVAGVLVWVLAVYPAYYVVHRPLNRAQALALADVAANLITWLAMLVMATALGSRLTRGLDYHTLLERIAFSAGLGLGVLSLLTLGLGLAGLLHGWLFWILLAGGGLLLRREIRELIGRVSRARVPRPRSPWQVLLSVYVAVTLLLALVATLLPPTEWDSLVYHLVGPERYLQEHRFTFELDNYYLSFPALVEMLFTAAMALKGDIVARLVHYGYLLLTLGGLGAFAARYWDRRLGLLAAALLLSIPTAVQVATWSYVDLALTFYSFGALFALLNWLEATTRGDSGEPSAEHGQAPVRPNATAPGQQLLGSGWGWLVMAGLFAGFSMSVKYTGVASLLVLGGVLIWSGVRRRVSVRSFLTGAVVLGGLALAVAAPWYIKNAVVAGNPIYPLMWGGREWNEISTRWLLVPGQEMSFLDLVIVPWTLTVVGKQGTVAYDATYSPLFLTLLPLLLVVPRRAKALGGLLLAAALGYLFWLASGTAAYGTFVLRGRQVLPIFAPLSLLCAFSLDRLRAWDRKGLSLQRVLTMITGLTLLVTLVSQVVLTAGLNPWPYLTGHQSRADYLDQYISQRLHQAITFLNEHLTADDRVIFVWEPRSYGCNVPHEADVLFDSFSQRLAPHGTPEQVAAGLRDEGFTHMLVNEYIYRWIVSDFPITPEEQQAWERFQARYLTAETLVHSEGDYLSLYLLSPGSGPIRTTE